MFRVAYKALKDVQLSLPDGIDICINQIIFPFL